MPGNQFADVVLPLPVDHPFTYEVPESLRGRVAVGMRAVVPVMSRHETGYIVALRPEAGIERVRPLAELPDTDPVFTPDMLDLCRWLADYYCCSLGEALACAAPAGMKMRARMRYTLLPEQLGTGRYSDKQRKIVAALYRRGPLTEAQLERATEETQLGSPLQTLTARGVLRAEPVRDRGVTLSTETFIALVEERIPPPEVLDALQRGAPKQAAVYFDLLHGEPERRAADLYRKHDVDSATIRALEKKGYVRRFQAELFRRPQFEADARAKQKLALNPDQQTAFDAITRHVTDGVFKTFLLQGITGSGKTEVYLQAIEHTLKQGRSAILLVPEISLTPQTVGRLTGRFGERIAVLHSALSQGERYDEWRRAQRGEVRIVVGARSAIFAPLANLGLIVVDEEHDNSYKQSDVPRYHARDVAIMRASRSHAVCVLGSATPSLESYHNAQIGKSERLSLRTRATQASLPEVQIVDLRHEAREVSGQVILSRLLEEEVRARIAAREQVILLLNRRGYSPFVLCPKCGWVAECPDCNVSLTYHSSGAFVSCHYCNHRGDVPAACATCGFNPLLFLGAGTQKVEDFIARSFPEARIERMDADSTAGKGGHARILGRFAAGEIDILIGTQMIAKGHDYPGVTLVGVVNADMGLAVPDFRAAEQTFQLLTQVGGRAGRGNLPGKVIIQTFRPNHYAVQAAASHDFEIFYQQELRARTEAGYPPVRRLGNLAIEAEDPLEAERAMAMLHRLVAAEIAQGALTGVTVLGPSPAAIYRVKKRYRWNLGLLCKSAKRLNTLARAARTTFTDAYKGEAALKIDLDPFGIF